MTPRERWLAVLTGEKPDRLPMDYWATDEATAKLLKHLGCADEREMCKRLHIDRPVIVSPAGYSPPWFGGTDAYGCRWIEVPYEIGTYIECVEHPLAGFRSIAELEANYTWPSLAQFDYSAIPSQIEGLEEYPVQGGGSEPFLRYTYLRGLEQAYRDLIVNREFVEHCLDKLFDLAYEHTSRIYDQIPGRVTVSYVAEDFGSQEGLLFSRNMA